MKRCIALCAVLFPALAFAGTDWELLQSGKGDVDIYKRQLAGDKDPEIKGVGTISAPPEQVLAVLTDLDRYAKLLPHLKKVELLKSGADEFFAYFYFDLPWPTSDRDYTVHYKWKKKGDSYLVTCVDANYWRPDIPKGVVRIENIRCSWLLEPTSDGKTKATYIFLADYGGDLPEFVKKDAWVGEPMELFKALRKTLSSK